MDPKNNGTGTTFDELIEMARNIDTRREEEAKRYLDSLLESRNKTKRF